jgi:DUF2934 family protein
MPRSKSPKKHPGTEVFASSSSTAVSNPGNGSPETIAAHPAAETMKTEMKNETPKKARKPQIVKADSRSNLVPINLEDEIRRLAYLLSERRGFEPGHETEDWVSAEREIRQRYHQQSA